MDRRETLHFFVYKTYHLTFFQQYIARHAYARAKTKQTPPNGLRPDSDLTRDTDSRDTDPPRAAPASASAGNNAEKTPNVWEYGGKFVTLQPFGATRPQTPSKH